MVAELLGRPAPVYNQFTAGDERRFVRRQVQGTEGHFFRSSPPAYGRIVQEALVDFALLPGRFCHRCVDGTGVYRIGANGLFGILDGS